MSFVRCDRHACAHSTSSARWTDARSNLERSSACTGQLRTERY
jgi:hypothetical protein